MTDLLLSDKLIFCPLPRSLLQINIHLNRDEPALNGESRPSTEENQDFTARSAGT